MVTMDQKREYKASELGKMLGGLKDLRALSDEQVSQSFPGLTSKFYLSPATLVGATQSTRDDIKLFVDKSLLT